MDKRIDPIKDKFENSESTTRSKVERTQVNIESGIGWIQVCGILLILMAIVLMTSNYFTGAESLWQALITALAGIYLGMAKKEDVWTSNSLLVVALMFTLFIIAEYFIMGLPDRFAPNYPATNTKGSVTFLGILNHLSPWIYLTLKCIVAMTLLGIIKKMNR